MRTNKKVMVVETAYSFTMENADGYKNLFGGVSGKISGFEVSKEGQLAYMKRAGTTNHQWRWKRHHVLGTSLDHFSYERQVGTGFQLGKCDAF